MTYIPKTTEFAVSFSSYTEALLFVGQNKITISIEDKGGMKN